MADKEKELIKRFVYDTSKEAAEIAYEMTTIEVDVITDLKIVDGVASWEEPDISDLIIYNPEISYLIYVNDEFIQEQTNTTFRIADYSSIGTNNLKIIVKAILYDNSKAEEKEYFAEYALRKMNSIIGDRAAAYTSWRIGQYIYVFGGRTGPTNFKNTIFKYDTLTDTYTTLEAIFPYAVGNMESILVGNYVYLFGGRELNNSKYEIYRFNVITEELDTSLEASIVETTYSFGLCTYNNFIYVLGGYDAYNNFCNKIQKYDTLTDTITTLPITLPCYMVDFGYATIGNILYMFGGSTHEKKYGSELVNTNKTLTFNMETETIKYDYTATPSWSYYTGMRCASIGTDVYMFGIYRCSSGQIQNTVIKFDSITKDFSTLNIAFDKGGYHRSVATLDNVIYVIGVYAPGEYLNRGYYGYVYKFSVADEASSPSIAPEAQ